MKPNHYYAPFRNFQGWEVWLYGGTDRLDRISGTYRNYKTAARIAQRMNRPEGWPDVAK